MLVFYFILHYNLIDRIVKISS